MGLFAWSDERIAEQVARLTSARDLAGLSAELRQRDARRRSAAAAALGSFGSAAVPAIVAATLAHDDEHSRRGAWAAFEAVGAPAATQVAAGVLSMDTLLADDVPATLRYYECAAAAIGPDAQDAVAALLDGRGPWRERAEACLSVRDTRDARINTRPAPGGHILMPISLGTQAIAVDQAEEVLRATSRQWAAMCFLNLTETNAVLRDGAIVALETAVVDALGDSATAGPEGMPELPPVAALRRQLAGERGAITRLETESLAARISSDDYPPAERRRREDLLVGTLALAALRKYARKGTGLRLAAGTVVDRFARLADSGPEREDPARASALAGRLAGLELCCEMHLGEPAAALALEPPVAAAIAAAGMAGTTLPLDPAIVTNTLRALRGPV